MPLRVVDLQDRLFKTDFRFVHGDEADFADLFNTTFPTLRRMSAGDRAGRVLAFKHEGNAHVWIWVKGLPLASPNGAAIFAHEAGHAVASSLEMCGVKAKQIPEEIRCYYVEWLIREILFKLEDLPPTGD